MKKVKPNKDNQYNEYCMEYLFALNCELNQRKEEIEDQINHLSAKIELLENELCNLETDQCLIDEVLDP